jgi:lipoyl(octanoyl) transferase
VKVRRLGVVAYEECWEAMREFTDQRGPDTEDELWLLQHPPVFTQGQAGKPEHLLMPGDIPVVQTDRGGQVTYHGPGQWVVYLLLDLRRNNLGVRDLVNLIEQSIVTLLKGHGVTAAPRRDAPGVYVSGAKIASLGLRVRRGCSYHGLALNIDMDLEPFARINPCGYEGLQVTTLRRCLGDQARLDSDALAAELLDEIQGRLAAGVSSPAPGSGKSAG